MSFLNTLENIGKDILKGIEIASPIVGTFVPAVGPILMEIAQVITGLETKSPTGTPLTAEQITSVINTIAAASVMKQSAGVTLPLVSTGS